MDHLYHLCVGLEKQHNDQEADLYDYDKGKEGLDEKPTPEAYQALKDSYAYLRYNLGKMDGYAAEALGALEDITLNSSYTDFDPDDLQDMLDGVQNDITEWQEQMRIIP